jgi:peptidoglycan/xylan/chitin deacetylase (PgdA/CDA1 family)
MLTVLLALVWAPLEIRHGLPPQTLVLTYHDFVESRDSRALWFDCTPSEFEDQLDWMGKRGAHFISVQTLYDHLTQGTPLPSHPVTLTFADNYLGFYLRALPILRLRHIPAIMFVHTGFVGSPIGRPKMNWTQLRELDREGLVTIGSQTVTHRSLNALDTKTVERELANSRRALETHLGHSVRFLAYPNGAFDQRCLAAASATGYSMAFSERLNPAEASPNIFAVARYVHTKYRLGWSGSNR